MADTIINQPYFFYFHFFFFLTFGGLEQVPNGKSWDSQHLKCFHWQHKYQVVPGSLRPIMFLTCYKNTLIVKPGLFIFFNFSKPLLLCIHSCDPFEEFWWNSPYKGKKKKERIIKHSNIRCTVLNMNFDQYYDHTTFISETVEINPVVVQCLHCFSPFRVLLHLKGFVRKKKKKITQHV